MADDSDKPSLAKIGLAGSGTVAGAEATFRLVIDAAPNAMLMVNHRGAIILVNSQAEKLFGYLRDELLGCSVEMLVPERFRGAHDGFRNGYFSRPDTRAMGAGRDLFGLRRDGSEVPIEIGLNPLRTEEGLFVLASIIDITERKKSEERFRLMVEAAPNAMIMVNREGRITLVNTQTEKLFGYPRVELIGQPVEILVPMKVRAGHPKLRDAFFAAPKARSMGVGRDLYGVTKSGAEIPVEIGLNPIETPEGLFTLASIIDISERKKAEERFRLMVEAAPNAMIMVNREGRITLVNTQTEKLFGYPRVELIGQPVEILVPMKVRAGHPKLRDAFFAAPKARSMGVGRDLYGVTKSGAEIPVEIGLNPIETPEGLFTLASIIDISERKRSEILSRLSHTNILRQSILDSVPFSIIALDTSGTIIAVNPASERMLGYSREEMVGQYAVALIHIPEEIERHAAEMSRDVGATVAPDHNAIIAKAGRGMRDESEWTYRSKDGTLLPVHLSITPLHDEGGKVTGFLKVAYDITERKRTEAYILHMAHHDSLTGLPNRVLLMDRIEMGIKRARRRNGRVGVLMMDLDHFKRVNDTLGHHVGDQLLIAVARRIQAELRESDTLARLGGDEFVVVVPDIFTREEMQRIVDNVVKQVSAPIAIDGQELLITPSVGGCLFPDDGVDANTLLKNADTAMYVAKSAGRSNSQWFSAEMLRQTQEKLALTSALKPALDGNQFSIQYQPEISLDTGQMIGVEALIRWQHPTRGDISPIQFIALAEEAGMILPIGDWVLRTACHDVVGLCRQLGVSLRLAVNVSPRQLQQKDWIGQISRALQESGMPATSLELEITEGTLMQNPDECAAMLREVRALGVRVVIDDFGTGYSSLSYLTRFPIDKIKIDRSFVRDLTVDVTDAAVIDAIIAMAHSLKIAVIAEGVETSEQLAYLHQRGCDEAQGFYFSSAVSLSAVPALFSSIRERMAAG